MMSSKPNKSRRALAEMTNDGSCTYTTDQLENGGNINNKNSNANNHIDDEAAKQAVKVQFLEEFVQDRVKVLENELIMLKQDQRAVVGKTMMKISKATRNMTLNEFYNTHGINLLDLQEEVKLPSPSASNVTAATAAATNTAASIPATPSTAFRTFNKATPLTLRHRPMATPGTRTIRRGEVVYSQHGSPLTALEDDCLMATVKAPRHRPIAAGGGDAAAMPASPEFACHLGDAGQSLSLQDVETLQHLDPNDKEFPAAQILLMHERLGHIVSRLKDK